MGKSNNSTGLTVGESIVLLIQMIITMAGLLIATGFAVNGTDKLPYIVQISVYILTVFYAVIGYAIPHGNILKYIYMAYAFAAGLIAATRGSDDLAKVLMVLAALLAAYMSGRLDRIGQNRKIIALVMLLLIARAVLTDMGVNVSFGPGAAVCPEEVSPVPEGGLLPYLVPFGELVQWITLAVSYLTRYKNHKEAADEN